MVETSAESSVQHHRIEELSSGVFAALSRREGQAVCNSGIVDLRGGGLVFDTGLTPRAGQSLRMAAEQRLGQPTSLAVVSHWHLDHMLGSQAFSGVPLWATRRTGEIILERRAVHEAELRRGELEKSLAELEGRRDAARTEGAQSDLEMWLGIHRALLDAAGTIEITAPDQRFGTELALPGGRGAELRSWGSGHTEADAVLFLPRERILFAGDLVLVGTQPSMGSGDPEHWLTVLDEIERLGTEKIVPGHGPVTDQAGIQETRAYLSGVLAAAEAPPTSPLPAALRRWEGSVSLEENLKFARGRRSAPRAAG